MTDLGAAVDQILKAQRKTKKPLAIVLAGHNGAGKSTMWRKRLSGQLQIPLINADRMMLSILPEPDGDGALVPWAQTLRDKDQSWMKVAQDGVQAFVRRGRASSTPTRAAPPVPISPVAHKARRIAPVERWLALRRAGRARTGPYECGTAAPPVL